jgi:hypothetical protein
MPERANIEEPAKDFDAQPAVAVAAPKKKWTPMVVLGTIGAVGGALIAINAISGLNFRPAWGYEVIQLASEDAKIMKRLDTILLIQDSTSKNLLQLNKGQYELRLHQIDRERRELRRELAEHQSRAQEFRDDGEPVPSWLRSTIADTDTSLTELAEERRIVETKLLGLGG